MKKYDQLKKTLRDYHVDIDKDKLWQQTSHAIPQKKKKRAVLIPIVIGVLLLSGGTLTYEYFTTSNETLVSDNRRDPLQKAAQEGNLVIKNQNKDHSITNTKKTNDATVHTRKNTYPTTEQAISKAETRPIDISPAMTVQTSPDQNRIDIIDDTDVEMNETPTDSRILLASFGSVVAIDALPISPVTDDAKENPLAQKRKPVMPHTPFRHIFYIGFLGSIGVSELSFSAEDKAADQMRAFLESNTRSLEAISATITGHVQLSKGFAAGAGLRYSRLTYEINYLSTITERNTTEGTTTIIIDENGQQHLVSGSLGSTHIRELDLFRYTTHQSLDLEMTLYKTLMDIRRTKINGYVKAAMNVAYGVTGSAFTGEQVLERFSENENPFERSSTLMYGAGVHMQYRIHSGWVLLAAAGFDQMNIRHREYQKLQWQNKSYSLSLGVGCVL